MIAKSLIRNAWYVAAFSEEIGRGQISGQTIARKPILLWRDESGRVAAFDNRCVHKRMPLSDGRLRNGQLECSYHGLCYDHSGACVSVPAHPDGSIPAQAKLRPYPVIEQDGMIWVWPGDPTMSATMEAKPIGAARTKPRATSITAIPSTARDATRSPATRCRPGTSSW